MKKAIQIDGRDNVATATSNASENETLEVISPEGAVILEPKTFDAIPFGHKLALVDLEPGNEIIKYGEIIGVASKRIRVGAWVHTHNVESATVPTSALQEE